MNHHWKQRLAAFGLAACVLLGLCGTSWAASLADGSKTCTVAPAPRYSYLMTTAGTWLGAGGYTYTTNDGLTGQAYCIDHGLALTDKPLPITGKYTVSPSTAGAFASGYSQAPLETFLWLYQADNPILAGLTEEEYRYATQLAVWATLGQLGVAGTRFTAGREQLEEPVGDTQQMRVFRAVQLIARNAGRWDRVYRTGMYIRVNEDKLGGNVAVPPDMTLDFAADREQYGIRREVINGKSYFTKEYIVASATSTYWQDYTIDLWAEGCPVGTIFTDLDNKELARNKWRETDTWRLPVAEHSTDLNYNGYEYSGKVKLCIPADTAPPSGEIVIHSAALVMQFEIYLAENPNQTQQSYIIADPSKGTQEAEAVLSWGGPLTEVGAIHLTKVGGGGEVLPGGEFTLSGSDGSRRTGVTNAKGVILWTGLVPNVVYTLTETKAPAGYGLMEPMTLTVTAARVSYLTVQDDPQHTLTVHKVDQQTGYSLRGAVICFEQIDGSYKTTATTDHAGNIQMNADRLPVGSYKVYEVTAPEGYELDETAQTVHWDGKRDISLAFNNVRKPTLVIAKKDSRTKFNLPGATFEVFKDGQLITTVTTDDNGLAYVHDISEGYYEVRETIAPGGYRKNDKTYGIYVDPYDPTMTDDPRLVVENDPLPGLRIVKYDRESGKPLPDTTFKVYRDTVLVGTYRTDRYGEIHLSDLEPGTYTVEEIATQDTHLVNSTPQSIELKAGQQEDAVLIFFNDLKPGIHLVKVDSETLEPLPNATYLISKVEGSFSKEYVTGKDGEIDLSKLEPGAYQVKEVKAPEGYLMDDGIRTIQLNAGENAQFVFTNTTKPSLTVVKYDPDANKYLPGATFRIVRIEDGSHYLDRVTDTQGRISVSDLEPGVYSVQEIAAPAGYILNSTEYHVELFPGRNSELVVTNRAKPSLKIVKTDAITGKPVQGVTFTIKEADGRTITTKATDEKGEILLADLEPGVIEVWERYVPDSYLLDENHQFITLVPNQQGEVHFRNYPKPGLEIIKLDEVTRTPIQGVLFQIDHNGKQVGTYLTGKDGRVILHGLEPGWYTVTEIKAASEYQLDPEPHTVEVVEGRTATLKLTNRKTGSALIHKIDSVTGKGIYGVTFLVCDAKGNPIGVYTSDQNGYVYVDGELANGKYTIREIQQAEGYLPDTTVKTFYVEYGGCSTITWYNTPVTGQIQITKTSADYNSTNGWPAGTAIPGCEFEVYNKAGNLVDTIRTDKNGIAATRALPLGQYRVVESKTADFYVLDDTPFYVDLLFAGQIVHIAATNKSVVTGVSITKSGYKEVMPGQMERFTLSNVGNTSTVSLQNFYWRDTIPVDALRLSRVVTGTWNIPSSYKLVYLTNKSGGQYRTLADNLSTGRNYTIDANPVILSLAGDEYVTEVMAVFGVIPAGFHQVETPALDFTVVSWLQNGYQFINQADVGGSHNGGWVQASSRWATTVYAPTKSLPRTGY